VVVDRLKRILGGEAGQNLVETALVLPLLLLVLAGIVDFGRAFTTYIAIANAAREGARVASHFPDNAGLIEEAVMEEASPGGLALDVSNITIDGLGAASGETIRVTVAYDVDTILGSIIGTPSFTVRSSTAMVVFGMDVDS